MKSLLLSAILLFLPINPSLPPPRPAIIVEISPISYDIPPDEEYTASDTESASGAIVGEEIIEESDGLYCSCVRTAHTFDSGIPLIDAKDFVANVAQREVRVGDFILEEYDGVHHVAYINDIQKEGYIVSEGNFEKCEYSDNRIVPYGNPQIRGFYRPDML